MKILDNSASMTDGQIRARVAEYERDVKIFLYVLHGPVRAKELYRGNFSMAALEQNKGYPIEKVLNVGVYKKFSEYFVLKDGENGVPIPMELETETDITKQHPVVVLNGEKLENTRTKWLADISLA